MLLIVNKDEIVLGCVLDACDPADFGFWITDQPGANGLSDLS